jgi:hypothetical protein
MKHIFAIRSIDTQNFIPQVKKALDDSRLRAIILWQFLSVIACYSFV